MDRHFCFLLQQITKRTDVLSDAYRLLTDDDLYAGLPLNRHDFEQIVPLNKMQRDLYLDATKHPSAILY